MKQQAPGILWIPGAFMMAAQGPIGRVFLKCLTESVQSI
mgnify:CR=1 FL=1